MAHHGYGGTALPDLTARTTRDGTTKEEQEEDRWNVAAY